MQLPPSNDSAGSEQAKRSNRRNIPEAAKMSLSERIHSRILRRLNERVRDLEVSVSGKQVVLRGQCSTYYSKQLAQHAALGVIEDENLENQIEVGVMG